MPFNKETKPSILNCCTLHGLWSDQELFGSIHPTSGRVHNGKISINQLASTLF